MIDLSEQYSGLEYPMTSTVLTNLLGIHQVDLKLVLESFNIEIPRRGRSAEYNEYVFNVVYLFVKVKNFLAYKNIQGYINVTAIGVLKSMTEWKVDSTNSEITPLLNVTERTVSSELTFEAIEKIVNEYLEA